MRSCRLERLQPGRLDQMANDDVQYRPANPKKHRPPLFAALGSLRLHQWVKNALVFAPLVLGGKAQDLNTWETAFIGFVAFGLTASGTYIINDLWDRSHDQRHSSKRNRPIASGAISRATAVGLAIICLVLGSGMGLWLGTTAFAVLMAYMGLTVTYTVWLKRLPIVDVIVIASLFSIRLAFGIVLSDVRWSPWLFVLSMCGFLSLALAKRFAELSTRSAADNEIAGRGYIAADAPFVRGLGLASATTAVLIMILYLIDEAFPRAIYQHPQRLWAAPVILFLFFGRIWLSAERGELVEDPVAFALRDRSCLFYALSLFLVFVVAIN